MVDDRHNRLPVRLVQENGNTIPLNVTAYDITVSRNHSQIPIPFANSKRLGIDLNMPQISVALTGVIADDDEVVGETSGAVGNIDVGFSIGYTSIASTNVAGGLNNVGGVGSGGTTETPPPANVAYLPTSYGNDTIGAYITNVNDLHGKYFELPVAYWGGVGGLSVAPTAPTSSPAMWLNAGDIDETTVNGLVITTWSDAGSNSYSPTQGTYGNKPTYLDSAINGHPAIRFSTVDDDDSLAFPYTASGTHALSSKEVTIFVVCTGDSVGDGGIVSNKSGYYGWSLKYGDTADDFLFTWSNGSSSFTVDTEASSKTSAHLISVVLEDTTGDGASNKGTIYRNGNLEETASGAHAPMSSGSQNLRIGYDDANYFDGQIGEVIIYNRALTEAERQATEAYLAGKYSLQLDSDHPYIRASSSGSYHIKYIFDADRQGSVKEPWGYPNEYLRVTNLAVTGVAGAVLTVNNDPREWIESVDLNNTNIIVGVLGLNVGARIAAVTSNQITLTHAFHGISALDTISLYFNTSLGLGPLHSPSGGARVVIIPIADLFDPPSTYNNGSTRDLSGATNPIEYLATKIAKAITLSDSLGSKVINPDNSGTSGADAFTTSVTQGGGGTHRGLVTIKQKVHGAFLPSQGIISHNFPTPTQVNIKPLLSAFTGGRVSTLTDRKSAGDKAQDLIGIINNMNNYYESGKEKPKGMLGKLTKGLHKVADTLLGQEGQKDYIEGIQIPYLSACLPTKSRGGKIANIADATPSGSNTVITTLDTHELLVGDQIEITDFSILNGTMAVNLNGDHTVSVVTNDTQFTISTSSTSNTGSAGGICKVKPESNSKLQWEQRNLFITSGSQPTYWNTSSANHNTLASTAFNRALDDHRQSGIRAIIDEFTVDFKAEDRIYEFDMTMIAVDYLV